MMTGELEEVTIKTAEDCLRLTRPQFTELLGWLSRMFDMVRLVEATTCRQYMVNRDGQLHCEPYQCYEVWNRDKRCDNCISTKVLSQKTRKTKLEFIGDDIYHIVAVYIELNGRPYSLEMVLKFNREVLLGCHNNPDLAEIISTRNERLYLDPIVSIYNRRYYEENLCGLTHINAVAMLDVDEFKSINDLHGHHAGDVALKAVAGTIYSSVRSTDVVTRYGGDEFVCVFPEIPEASFRSCLERIRSRVEAITLEEYPQLRVTVSIGGVYGQGMVSDMLR